MMRERTGKCGRRGQRWLCGGVGVGRWEGGGRVGTGVESECEKPPPRDSTQTLACYSAISLTRFRTMLRRHATMLSSKLFIILQTHNKTTAAVLQTLYSAL